MPTLRELQNDFLTALYGFQDDPAPATPRILEWIQPGGPLSPAQRFKIYQESIFGGQVGALRLRFPVLESTVGAETFLTWAHGYVRQYPSDRPNLNHYGDLFGNFVHSQVDSPLGDFYRDLTALEQAFEKAYFAPNPANFDLAQLTDLRPDQQERLSFGLAPSLQRLTLPEAVVQHWCSAQPTELGFSAAGLPGDRWFVWRPQLKVQLQPIDLETANFLEQIALNQSLGSLAESCPNINQLLPTAIAAGWIDRFTILSN